jgi:hypothetical protein
MDLLQKVPSLELCRKLENAGFPQNTKFAWAEFDGEWLTNEDGDPVQELPPYTDVRPGDVPCSCLFLCAAPTMEEILKALPKEVSARIEKHHQHGEKELITAAEAYLQWKQHEESERNEQGR